MSDRFSMTTEGASNDPLSRLKEFDLPEDYISTLADLDGGEGFIRGEHGNTRSQ